MSDRDVRVARAGSRTEKPKRTVDHVPFESFTQIIHTVGQHAASSRRGEDAELSGARHLGDTGNGTALIAALRNWQHKGSARGFCAVTSAKEAYASCTTTEIREVSCFARSSRDGIRLRSCTKERRSRGDRRRSCDRRGRRRRSRGDRRRSCDRREEERAHDVVISGHQWSSEVIRGHKWS